MTISLYDITVGQYLQTVGAAVRSTSSVGTKAGGGNVPGG